MDRPQHFPFSKLALPAGEEILWYANNATFHRSWDYGLLISDEALYLFSPFWLWLSRWRRYPISGIDQASFIDPYWLPKLILRMGPRKVIFRAPFDGYQDEMNFDRKHLAKAADLRAQHDAALGTSSKPTRDQLRIG
jgi:hypothetical protein